MAIPTVRILVCTLYNKLTCSNRNFDVSVIYTMLIQQSAIDSICRMAELYEKGTQGSVLAWRAASLLLGRLLLLY